MKNPRKKKKLMKFPIAYDNTFEKRVKVIISQFAFFDFVKYPLVILK
jgi:hypothetical protein